MTLNITTFSNKSGGQAFFKALGHPKMHQALLELRESLRGDQVYAYDPDGYFWDFVSLAQMDATEFDGVFVQDLSDEGKELGPHKALLVDQLPQCPARVLLILSFDRDKVMSHVGHLVPPGCTVITLEPLKLPKEMVRNHFNYLDNLNFSANYCFFRDLGDRHTRLTTVNFWNRYGAKEMYLWLYLVDASGNPLAEWTQNLDATDHTISIDSQEVRQRFGLGDFTGQLFIHAVGAVGHDIIKYALDTYGDDPADLSCTHDANAWPSDSFGGLPAPEVDGDVLLWLQNSHPITVKSGVVILREMGTTHSVPITQEIPPYGTLCVSLTQTMPDLKWPAQVEILAGKYFVRPRYELLTPKGKKLIAHVNVQRVDLKTDFAIKDLTPHFGKGYILPAPVWALKDFSNILLPTPMSTAQESLPLQAVAYGAHGEEMARISLGNLPRSHRQALDLNAWLGDHPYFQDHYGHVELMYDFDHGHGVDGWIHALFRYEDLKTHHRADTSFGAHIFNAPVTYRGEPKSYSGKAPGLRTRLLLRVFAEKGTDTHCHLIYAVSKAWHPESDTTLYLHNGDGTVVAHKHIAIPQSGSYFFQVNELFGDAMNGVKNPYVIIEDKTCRLFGYHGMARPGHSFSLDHMFGC